MFRFVHVAAMLVLLAPAGAGADGQATPAPTKTTGASTPAAARATAATAAPVNINTASAAQLAGLPGIGARTAQAIVDHRQKAGGFKKIEELMNVKGIGEKSFLKMKPMITVSGDKAEKSGDR